MSKLPLPVGEGTKAPILLFTCEHGGNQIPAPYRAVFRGAADVLRSHRGWDPGALELAQRLAAELKAKLFSSTTSRLLVELNRSTHHRSLFSQFTRPLERDVKDTILREYYQPYRAAVQQYVAQQVTAGRRVLHLSIHSFTPVLDGEVRAAELGLLYDPARHWERAFSAAWRSALMAGDASLRVRKNYPYLGSADGFTTYLRTKFNDAHYAGVELEVNQRFPLGDKKAWRALQKVIVQSLHRTLNPDPSSTTQGLSGS